MSNNIPPSIILYPSINFPEFLHTWSKSPREAHYYIPMTSQYRLPK